MIILLRSDDLSPDPRVEKYVSFYKEREIPYCLIGWNRSSDITPERKDSLFYKKKAGYGNGLKNIFNLIGWNFFLFKKLIKTRREYKVIHACDFDTMVPAIIIKILFGKRVVFDVFDWYTDSRIIKQRILRSIVKGIEQWATKHADFIIICEEERIIQLPKSIDRSKVFVHRNMPDLQENTELVPFSFPLATDKKYILSYVGVFDKGRGLEDLLKAVSCSDKVILYMAGFGGLIDIVKSYAEHYPNIIYLGPIKHEEAMSLMGSSDIVVGMYYTVNRNHVLAAPNKYYEALFLGRPLLTNEGTIVGDRTSAYHTGYVIKEGEKYIIDFINFISQETNELYGKNAKDLFWSKYANSSREFLNGDYYSFIRS